jgi:hypothetical protein
VTYKLVIYIWEMRYNGDNYGGIKVAADLPFDLGTKLVVEDYCGA